MRIVIFGLAALGLAACDVTVDAPAETDVAASGETLEADDEAWARDIIKQAAEDYFGGPVSDIRMDRVDGEIVCGRLKRNGAEQRFYADVVDEEFFPADGPTAALYEMACT